MNAPPRYSAQSDYGPAAYIFTNEGNPQLAWWLILCRSVTSSWRNLPTCAYPDPELLVRSWLIDLNLFMQQPASFISKSSITSSALSPVPRAFSAWILFAVHSHTGHVVVWCGAVRILTESHMHIWHK